MQATRFLRAHLTYANVAATLALALALSMGGAYAAGKIGSAQIERDAVKSRHIADAGVGTEDLGKRSVTRAKLAADAQTKVVEYRLGAHDFVAQRQACIELRGLSRSAVSNGVWSAQLNDEYAAGNPTLDDIVYPVPGGGEFGASQYRVFVQAGDQLTIACVVRQSGPGEAYEAIRFVRTLPIRTMDGQRWVVPGQ